MTPAYLIERQNLKSDIQSIEDRIGRLIKGQVRGVDFRLSYSPTIRLCLRELRHLLEDAIIPEEQDEPRPLLRA